MNPARARLVAQTIGSLLGQEARRTFAGETTGGSNVAADRRKQRAVAIREAMERLGPLYIKIGHPRSSGCLDFSNASSKSQTYFSA